MINESKINDLSRTVIVSHPSRVLVSYQSALAMQEANLLRYYETGFYYKDNSIYSKILSFLPYKISNYLNQQFLRRTQEGLDFDFIKTHPLMDVLFTISARFNCTTLAEAMMYWRNECFDETVARTIKKDPPRAVIAYDSTALKTFKACGRYGTLRILDQVVGHMKTWSDILREEAIQNPGFVDKLSMKIPDSLIQRCTKEAFLADKVLAPSEYVRDTLIENGVSPSKIVILPYGVDVNRFRSASKSLSDQPFRILYVGQISLRKGIKYLLDAFKNLRLEKAELVLMGQIMISEKALEPYSGLFKHISIVPYSELHNFYKNADIFVYPSLHEGSALAIYEALASGLPVITTRNSGSIVRDGVEGFIVPIRDVKALMDKMLLLYHNRDLKESMSRNARTRAECFTWENYRQRLGSLIRVLIEEQKR